MIQPIEHSTMAAREQAAALGLDLTNASFRFIAIAITDAVANDGVRASPRMAALWVGLASMERERWSISYGRLAFDVLYLPEDARIVSVLRPRPGVSAASAPADLPPLVDAAAA